jgi:8-amino-7-oxononanoate synthase
MQNFTSALYLGFSHPSASLAPWRALTLGRPAALEEPPGAGALARELAVLMTAEAGLLYPSTLHLFRDLFQAAAPKGSILLFDASSYPIARWGAERVQLDGIPVETYPHHDATMLERRLRKARRAGQRPIVVTDGLCPSCGQPAPLPALARIAADTGGRLVIDDTQALGVLGREPSPAQPLGVGGGGSLAWHGLWCPHIIAGASLAKAFGAPIALLCGSADIVESIARDGETRIHTSPPSVANITAAKRAVILNRVQGDSLRARIVRLVEHLRAGLEQIGMQLISLLPIPMQTIAMPSLGAARAALASLEASGIRALVTRSCRHSTPSLTLLVTARHGPADINRLVAALARTVSGGDRFRRIREEAA